MALVMLPCDLPWWDSVKKQLQIISNTKNTVELIETMQKIHEFCNVSLDPDEETTDPELFIGLLNFLDNDLTTEERSNFLNKTLPNLVKRALSLKEHKPKDGLHFSLQQQPDCTVLKYTFVASLIANAFFSTFPKRTDKSHPTLQNFNFTNFFKHLHKPAQKTKLKSILFYFDWLENNENDEGTMKISRQVMTGREWLTIEDWLECSLPLSPLQIRHEGKLERADADSIHICFASSKIGGAVLSEGNSQECVNLVTFPEMLMLLLNVEALEDNEVVTVENLRHISRIADPKNRALLERLENPPEITVCCIDADDYKKLPIGQYEEDNVLRELNKCLLAFQQKPHENKDVKYQPQSEQHNFYKLRRLSPIGESVSSSTQSDALNIPIINQQSCSTNKSTDSLNSVNNNVNQLNVIDKQLQSKNNQISNNETLISNRRGRFIVLGSSGECLPVTRRPMEPAKSICSSSEDEFHSAKTSLDGSEDENYYKRYSIDLETAERRHSFAQRLKDALRREEVDTSTSSSESGNYAVGISISGCNVHDGDIKVRRGGSTGFALREDSLDEDFLRTSLQQEKLWIDKFKNKQTSLSRKESSKSSEYSFSTEYSSEFEEVFEQFSRWLENPILETDKETKKELEGRDLAVVQFAGSLLKRTLSESFAGVPVPLTEGSDKDTVDNSKKKNKWVLNAKSLSLELARHKHKLAAQLMENIENSRDYQQLVKHIKKYRKKRRVWYVSCVNEAVVQNLEEVSFNFNLVPDVQSPQLSQINHKPTNGLKSVSTGNWGCGTSRAGDVQLKVIIQWLAASVAGIPCLIYYTYGHQQLVKLDTVCRILIDRKWTVKELAHATLKYANQVLMGNEVDRTLFEELISTERNI